MSEKPSDRKARILGRGIYQPRAEYVCFLPWYGEFGWYIMNHVKRVHGYNHSKKIVCLKRGHECLFPSAYGFYYCGNPYPDGKRAGVGRVHKVEEDKIRRDIKEIYGESVRFIRPQDTSWQEKKSLAKIHFVPQSRNNFGLDVDVVITPRKRQIDRLRNFRHWQKLINMLTNNGLTVGACGSKESSQLGLERLKHKSWDYVDIDSDIEMITKSKVVVSQESGLAYLTMLCEKPLMILDNPHREIALLHNRPEVPYRVLIDLPFNQKIRAIIDQVQLKSRPTNSANF